MADHNNHNQRIVHGQAFQDDYETHDMTILGPQIQQILESTIRAQIPRSIRQANHQHPQGSLSSSAAVVVRDAVQDIDSAEQQLTNRVYTICKTSIHRLLNEYMENKDRHDIREIETMNIRKELIEDDGLIAQMRAAIGDEMKNDPQLRAEAFEEVKAQLRNNNVLRQKAVTDLKQDPRFRQEARDALHAEFELDFKSMVVNHYYEWTAVGIRDAVRNADQAYHFIDTTLPRMYKNGEVGQDWVRSTMSASWLDDHGSITAPVNPISTYHEAASSPFGRLYSSPNIAKWASRSTTECQKVERHASEPSSSTISGDDYRDNGARPLERGLLRSSIDRHQCRRERQTDNTDPHTGSARRASPILKRSHDKLSDGGDSEKRPAKSSRIEFGLPSFPATYTVQRQPLPPDPNRPKVPYQWDGSAGTPMRQMHPQANAAHHPRGLQGLSHPVHLNMPPRKPRITDPMRSSNAAMPSLRTSLEGEDDGGDESSSEDDNDESPSTVEIEAG